MSTSIIIIAIIGGFVAGVINTLAGNGSAITLTILTEMMGLPGNVANATNRVGVLAQGSTGTYTFYKNGKLKLNRSKWQILIIFIGAVLGVLVAINISNETFISVFKYLLIVMLLIILIKPKKWLIKTQNDHQIPWYFSVPMFLALGFYGGFIQMGMGVFFLAVMVLIAKYNIMEANAIKGFVVLLYTIVVLAIFQYKGLVDWKVGGILAIGQASGGYVAAQFGSKHKLADQFAYVLLILVIIFAIIKNFKLLSW